MLMVFAKFFKREAEFSDRTTLKTTQTLAGLDERPTQKTVKFQLHNPEKPHQIFSIW